MYGGEQVQPIFSVLHLFFTLQTVDICAFRAEDQTPPQEHAPFPTEF